MVDHNKKRTPVVQHVHFGIQRILCLKAVAHWVHQKGHEGVVPSIDELNIDIIRKNICEMTIDSAADTKRDDKMFHLTNLILRSMCRGHAALRTTWTLSVAKQKFLYPM
jgi:hypothetical protein